MDYEKAYKEALAIARKLQSGEGVPIPLGMTAYELMFPELRESEDERIRKAIIALLNTTIKGKKLYSIADTTRSEMVAWLKKKGEQKPTPQTNERSWLYLVDDVLTWKDGIGQYLDNPRVQELAKKLEKDYSSKLFVKEQGEQKPAWNIAPQNLDLDSDEYKKILEEIDREILCSSLIPKLDYMPMTELPKMATSNYARQYPIYGVPVIADSAKLYILKLDIPEGKKAWYKRLWLFIKSMFGIRQ